jgi:hypothetical protein
VQGRLARRQKRARDSEGGREGERERERERRIVNPVMRSGGGLRGWEGARAEAAFGSRSVGAVDPGSRPRTCTDRALMKLRARP